MKELNLHSPVYQTGAFTVKLIVCTPVMRKSTATALARTRYNANITGGGPSRIRTYTKPLMRRLS